MTSVVPVHVVVTRATHQTGAFADLLRQHGFTPVSYPCIAIQPPEDAEPLLTALRNLDDYDWLVLTSANTLVALLECARLLDQQPNWHGVAIATVGETTAAVVRDYLAAEVAFIAPESTAESLAETLPITDGMRVFLPQSEIATPDAENRLTERGAVVTAVTAYTTGCASDGGEDVAGMLNAGQIDALTFMSGSAARCFVERLAPVPDEVYDLPAFCIGSSTAQVAREVGLRVIFTPPVDDFSAEGLVQRLVEYFES